MCISAAVSCDPNPLPVRFVGSGDGSVQLNIDADGGHRLKSSLGSGIEEVFTGAALGVYDSATGLLAAEVEIPADKLGGSMLISLPMGRTYDFYLLGNLRLMEDDGSWVLPSFPATSAEMDSFSYRLDGGEADTGLRRESFAEVSRWGIPMCWSRKGVDPFTEGSVDIRMERLFAKLVLTVDHAGIAGTDLEAFRNGSVHIRQSNCLLKPFAQEGSKAASAADVIPVSDYESTMENGLLKDFVFYVPENRQGVLMPDNRDPAEKDIDGVDRVCGGGVSGLLTYLEFKGHMDGSRLGFDGEVVYRFFLGRDATSDFDVERNREIHVSLKFNPESVFEPDWKLDSGGLEDGREFFLSGDLAGRLPEGKEIVVRKNRPGTFALNLVLEAGGTNRIGSATLVDSGYEPSSLADFAWTSDFWSAGHNAMDEPRRAELAELGISVSYSDGKFSFSVTDPSKFVTGRRIPLKLSLLPGGVETTAVIVTGEDISVEEVSGKSLYEDFFLAQSRGLKFKGFAGEKIYYMADQDEVRNGVSAGHGRNIQWKTSNRETDAFVYCRLDAAGDPVYPYQDYGAYESQSLGKDGELKVYAFFPNNFYSGGHRSVDGHIYICSDDIHNDGLIAVPLRIRQPYFKAERPESQSVYFRFDGNEVPVSAGYYESSGGSRLKPSEFDPELYRRLLSLQLEWRDKQRWADCIKVSDDQTSMYLYRTTLDGKGIEESIRGVENIGSVQIKPNPSTGLYTYVSSQMYHCYVSVPYHLGGPYLKGSDYFNYDTGRPIEANVLVSYPYNDPEVIEFSTDGPTVNYITQSGELIEPVLDIGLDGSNFKLSFDESRQPEKSRNGDFIPGGLLVPYGDHTMTMKVTNRWDGRSLEFSYEVSFDYDLILGQFAIFRPKRMATVYITGTRNVKYLEKYGSDAPWEDVQFMLEILGSDEWQSHVSVRNAYLYDKVYHVNSQKNYYGPADDFDVAFVSPGVGTWTRALADKSMAPGSLWLNGMGFHKNGVRVYDGEWVSDIDITGHPDINELFVSTTQLGYIFRNRTEF